MDMQHVWKLRKQYNYLYFGLKILNLCNWDAFVILGNTTHYKQLLF